MRPRSLGRILFFVFLAAWSSLTFHQTAAAQVYQFWPEVDTYVNLTESTRLWVQADRLHDEGNPTKTEIGPSLEFTLKPLVSLRKLAEKQPDRAKQRVLTLTMGYRNLFEPGFVSEHRVVLEASPRFPFVWKMLVTDRNRGELRVIAGQFSWRYRNRMTVERTISMRSYSFSPYVRCEGYYDSRYNKWSDVAVSLGASFPIKKHAELEPYLQHENQTGSAPNQQFGTLGLKLYLYFREQE